MTTLYIRLPSRAAAGQPPQWNALPCPFAVVANNGAIEREAIAPLSELSGIVRSAQRTVLLLAASDVSLLRVKVPPMSVARLRAALPNLVEDHLIGDPADQVVVAGREAEGLRTVAVVQRDWLELLMRTLRAAGARQLVALPSQLCLPWQPEAVGAAVTGQGTDIDLTVRLSPYEGIGLPILPEQPQDAAREVFEAIAAVVPQGSVVLYVPGSELPAYQAAAEDLTAHGERILPRVDSWQHWIAGARDNPLDLIAGLGAAGAPKLEWRRWRWPLALAMLLLVVNVVALNYDWWRLRGEAGALRTAMTRIYRSAYPKDTLIVDPLAQMRQKIAGARRASGEAAPDDFTMLAARFGEAWSAASQGRAPPIAGLEYKERALLVRIKPGGQAPTVEQMQPALAARGLSLAPAPAQAGATVWQIRSGK